MIEIKRPLISLCIPTNGVIEWVFPPLDSIYIQNVDETMYEVIVADNGCNLEFERLIREYASQHSNLHYYKTNALPFINEIESYKKASGIFIKYLNHRSLLRKGTLDEYIKFVNMARGRKPVVYFANGVLKGNKKQSRYNSFDHYVRKLSYFSSWSTGMAFWKEDFDKVDLRHDLSELFPHTKILFNERKRQEYIVDNRKLLDEQKIGKISKGKYDLFYAFGVDYLGILTRLVQDGDISIETFLRVKHENLRYMLKMHLDFVVRKLPCSYDISSFRKSMRVYYGCGEIIREYLGVLLHAGVNRIYRKVGMHN